jgi:TolB-like protein
VVRATDRTTGVEGPGNGAALYGGGLTWSAADETRYRVFTSGGEITTRVILSGKLFRVSDGTLLWSSSTEIKLGESYDQDGVVREAAGTIAEQLRHDKIFE